MKKIMYLLVSLCIAIGLTGCGGKKDEVTIGVSFGVGQAVRWEKEKEYMEAQAEELGALIEVRLNKGDGPKTQQQDCFELIDSGIDVLIITPRDANDVGEIMEYANKKKVPVISYARIIQKEAVELFVGYDSNRIGQKLGQYLSEMVYEGDYIILSGDPKDANAKLLYDGAMRYISQIGDSVNVILDTEVEGWDPEVAKALVKEAVQANENKVDGILAPNDKIAGACVEALKELGIEQTVIITGMDAELDALKRIVDGTQAVTIYMDLQELASTAVNEAYHMAKGETVNVNAEFENNSGSPVAANLITGELITKENMDSIILESGYFTREEIYGE